MFVKIKFRKTHFASWPWRLTSWAISKDMHRWKKNTILKLPGFISYTWMSLLPAVLTVDTHLFHFSPSGKSAGIRKSVRERATAFGWAKEKALRVGWSSSNCSFWGERRNLLAGQSGLFVTKTQQTRSYEETCAGPETQHPTQNYSKMAVKKRLCCIWENNIQNTVKSYVLSFLLYLAV